MKTYTFKQIGLLILLCFSTTSVFGQGIYDALRFSKTEREGTARSIAMGNAFTALGGDLGAISINPAATAIYRYSSFAFTPSLNINEEISQFLDQTNHSGRTRFAVSNLGYVSTYQTGRQQGLISLNFAITADQIANYNAKTVAYGTNSQSSLLGSFATGSYGIDPLQLGIDENFDPFYRTSIPPQLIQAYNSYLTDPILSSDPNAEFEYIGATETFDKDGNIVLAGPVRQSYNRVITGYNDQITFSFGGNISNQFFFGINLNLQSINYYQKEFIQEGAVNPEDFQETGFRSMQYGFNLTTTGSGFNAQVGFIWLPIQGLRIGGSIATPTWFQMHDQWYYTMDSELSNKYYCDSPGYEYYYNLQTPFFWNLGMAYVVGQYGIISIDYERTDYRQAQLSNDQEIGAFFQENEMMQRNFKAADVLRVGAEYRTTEQFSIRAGYNYYSSTNHEFSDSHQYISAGIGYANQGFFFDIAYQQPIGYQQETFTYYPVEIKGTPYIDNQYRNARLLATIGFRF